MKKVSKYYENDCRFGITFAILSWEKLTKDKRLSVKYWICKANLLLLLIKEHCVAKWELKSSSFSLKPVTNLFSWNESGTRGIFSLFKRRINRDQYT